MATARSLATLTLGLGLCLGTAGCSDSSTSAKPTGPNVQPEKMREMMQQNAEKMRREQIGNKADEKGSATDKPKADDKSKPEDKSKSN